MRLFFALCLSTVLICPARATTYVVDQNSPAADDRGPGTAAASLRTIGAAAQRAQAGDTVLIEPGVYREAVRLKTSGTAERPIIFRAAKAGQVIVSGADVMSGWQREPGGKPVYVAPWPHDFIIDKRKTGIDARIYGSQRPLAPVCCAEMFVSQGKPLRQVMRLAELAEGKFFVNWDTHRVYVLLPGGADPNQVGVEGCSRQTLFGPIGGKNDLENARFIQVKGITFRYAANWAQQGMVQAGYGWVLEDCIFEWCNAKAVTVRDEGKVIRCIAQDNGAGIGLRALPSRECAIERVTICNNRIENWRTAAIATSIGHWTAESVRERHFQIENNRYDAPADSILVHWGKNDLKTLAEAQQVLGTFRDDTLGPIAFDRPLVPLRSVPPLPPGISEAYQKAHAKVGDTVVVPIYGRSAFQQNAGKTTVLVYDLRNKWLELEVSPADRAVLEQQLPQWPGSEPIYLRVRVVTLSGKPLKAVCLAVGVKP